MFSCLTPSCYLEERDPCAFLVKVALVGHQHMSFGTWCEVTQYYQLLPLTSERLQGIYRSFENDREERR